MTFFSSFGQTFMVSLYVPEILKEFDLTSSSFGTIYGAATVLSGLSLVYGGRLIDRCNLRTYTLTAVLLLIVSCFCIALSTWLLPLFLGFWGLRFAGQGLFSHISSTSISKFFDESRGKALSLSVMGYSVGEACFPYVIGMIIGLIGWRRSMFLNGIMIGTTLIPFVFVALRNKRHCVPVEVQSDAGKSAFSSRALWTDKRFLIIVVAATILPFATTGLFFHQVRLAHEKGWALAWLTASFLGYALGRTVFALVSGKLIDRFSALKVFPYHMSPFLLALAVLIFFDNALAAPVYLTLTGVAIGFSSTVKTALLAEIYGIENLGSIKSMATIAMVLGTAISPALFGLALDNGLGFRFIGIVTAGIVFSIMILCSRLRHYVERAATDEYVR